MIINDETIKSLWPDQCFLCEVSLEPEEKHIVKAIVPLKVHHPDCEAFYTKTYCVCQSCKDKGELV